MKSITYKLFPFLISLLFLFPILKESLSSFFIILLCVNTLLYSVVSKNFKSFNVKILFFTIPFWIILIRSLLSGSLLDNITPLRHALFFLICPIFFSLIPSEFFSFKKINLYLSILKNTCLAIACVYVISFFITVPQWKYSIVFQNVSVFREYIYNDFKLFVIHPTYYTTILILCIAHSFDLVLNKRKFLQLIYIFSFIVISFLLLTRLNIVLEVLVLVTMLLINNKASLKQKIGFTFSIFALIASLAFFTPGIKARFVELINSFNVKPENLAYDSTNVRQAVYTCGWEVSKEHLLFGVGFDQLQGELNKCYQSVYRSSFYTDTDYLTHNYYTYILASSGFIGLILFIIYIAFIVRIAFSSRIFLFKVFIAQAIIICFFEDFMYRHYGGLYFNLLLMLFIQHHENNKSIAKQEL